MIEQRLQAQHSIFKYNPLKTFGGCTECFSTIIF
jgi:hypothetical protein